MHHVDVGVAVQLRTGSMSTVPSLRRRARHEALRLVIGALVAAVPLSFLSAGLQAAPQQEPACHGRDMLGEVRRSDPTAYSRIEAKSAAIPNGEAMLWRISRPGIAPSHLFGTIHISDERVTRLPQVVAKALRSSRQLALEVADLSPAAASGAIGRMREKVIFSDGRSLRTLLAPDELAQARDAARIAGLPEQLFAVARPWLLTTILAVSDCERKRLGAGKLPLDLTLARIARRHAIPVAGLETIEEQLDAMAAVPEADQLTVLKASLKLQTHGRDALETILQRYLAREVGKVWPMQEELWRQAGFGPEAFATFHRQLISLRNARMRTAALPLLAKGNVFVAVGALHLIGKDGLVALLREAGYQVTPLD